MEHHVTQVSEGGSYRQVLGGKKQMKL